MCTRNKTLNCLHFDDDCMYTIEKLVENIIRNGRSTACYLPIIWKSLGNMQIHWHCMMRMMRMMCDCCRGCCIVSMCHTEARMFSRPHCMVAEHSGPRWCTKTTLIHCNFLVFQFSSLLFKTNWLKRVNFLLFFRVEYSLFSKFLSVFQSIGGCFSFCNRFSVISNTFTHLYKLNFIPLNLFSFIIGITDGYWLFTRFSQTATRWWDQSLSIYVTHSIEIDVDLINKCNWIYYLIKLNFCHIET